MNAAYALSLGLHEDARPAAIIATATCPKGGRFVETFRGPNARIAAAEFRRLQESYGCTVDLRVLA